MLNKKKIYLIIVLIILNIIFLGLSKNIYAENVVIKLKPGETIKKELVPNLGNYEVLSLNENGSGKESIEKNFSNPNFDISFRLEGAFGDKLIVEIKAKKEGKVPQEIKYYMYKKEGEPFTSYRSEILIDIEAEKKDPKPNENHEQSNEKPEKPNENNKINIPSSEVKEKVNPKLIKVYPQNVTYVTKASVYLREGNSIGTNSIKLIPEGEEVISTGYTDNGWIRVSYNGKEGFMSLNFLTLKKISNLTDEMKKKAKEDEKEYLKEVKKVGIVNSKGENKDKQMEMLKKKIGSIPNVGNNLQMKIFLGFSILSLFIILIYKRK